MPRMTREQEHEVEAEQRLFELAKALDGNTEIQNIANESHCAVEVINSTISEALAELNSLIHIYWPGEGDHRARAIRVVAKFAIDIDEVFESVGRCNSDAHVLGAK